MNNIRIEKNGESVVLKADISKMSARDREDLARIAGIGVEYRKKNYTREYIKKNVIMASVSINKVTEPDIAEYMEGIDNKSAYIKKLIRAEMKRSKANEM